MTETLFERYKEALRAGHVAVVRGRLDDAATAYRDAIGIAGDRVLPRAALGGVLLRLGDPAAALEAYEDALGLAPDDDAALLGRAQALVVLRRTADAAATYDRLAEVRDAGGRRADAAEAARRALAIEPTDDRRRRHAALAEAGEPLAEPVAPGPPAPPPVDAEALVVEAEDALERGDRDAAGAAALAAARAYADRGLQVAAVDACLLGIEARPADADLHLLLARLGAERAGTPSPADAHQRLLRLVELDGDEAAAARVRSAVAAGGAVTGGGAATADAPPDEPGRRG
jgi:tetratricopeptide (TPR) repeat protein